MACLRLHTWLLLLLLPLLGTARPAASASPALPSCPRPSLVSAGSAEPRAPGVTHERTGPRETVLAVRTGSLLHSRGLAEDPTASGQTVVAVPRLRLRMRGARCAPAAPLDRLGLGASDLPPPAE